jgi:hypothetical protein
MMTKDDVMKAQDVAFEAGARLARANEFLASAKLIVDKARVEVDMAGAAFSAANSVASKVSADAYKAIGESVRKAQDAAIGTAQLSVIAAADAAPDAQAIAEVKQ